MCIRWHGHRLMAAKQSAEQLCSLAGFRQRSQPCSIGSILLGVWVMGAKAPAGVPSACTLPEHWLRLKNKRRGVWERHRCLQGGDVPACGDFGRTLGAQAPWDNAGPCGCATPPPSDAQVRACLFSDLPVSCTWEGGGHPATAGGRPRARARPSMHLLSTLSGLWRFAHGSNCCLRPTCGQVWG
jgi:hypothetical protein